MTRSNVALASGLVGAATLTLIHETGRRLISDAPRMDVLGKRALIRGFAAMDATPPSPNQLHALAFAGDLLANSLYYSAVPARTAAVTWQRGAALGLAAGLGALALPERIGLGTPPHSESRRNQVLTVMWYLVGGLAAAVAATRMNRATPR